VAAIEKHYVEFYSPGTLFSESSCKPIDSWDTKQACEMANSIQKRYNAKPYAFRFTTFLEVQPIPYGRGGMLTVEPKEIAKSALHFLGGKLIRYEEVPDDDEHSIMRSNMRSNNMPVVIENCNSWKYTGEFGPEDCIVDADGAIVRRGNDPDLAEYRATATATAKEALTSTERKTKDHG
jgi:hypothetical protein